MSKYLNQVREFHEAFNHPISSIIVEDNDMLKNLRISLLFEELEELSCTSQSTAIHFHSLCEKASSNVYEVQDGYDKVEALDAFCDIQYVLSGAILAMGFTDVFDEAFDEVHRSNMTKACVSNQEALDTIEYHKGRGEIMNMGVIEKAGLFLVLREDHKIMKSINYSPADLTAFI